MPIGPDLHRAIEAVLAAGVGQKEWLERNAHPPLYATLTDAVRFYGGPRAALSLWSMVGAVELLRAVVEAEGEG